MKRLGMFSGKIYSEDEVNDMYECGFCITDQQASDDTFIEKTKEANLVKCGGCFGCPMAEILL